MPIAPGFLKRLGRVFASALSHDHNARSGRRHNNAVLGAEVGIVPIDLDAGEATAGREGLGPNGCGPCGDGKASRQWWS